MKIGLLQITSVLDFKINIDKILSFKEQIKREKIEALFLPECFYSLSDGLSVTPYFIEENNEHYENIKLLAKELNTALIGGSAITKVKDSFVNRAYCINSSGEILQTYDKIHLFGLNLKGEEKTHLYQESNYISAGNELKSFKFLEFNLGLSICFDLRFPELYRSYFRDGINLISIASAFTVPTGKAHWHTLVSSRAIENQSYVVAVGQVGKHNHRISTYGHSLLLDPWGKIIIDAGEEEGLFSAEINLNLISEVRGRMKVTQKLSF